MDFLQLHYFLELAKHQHVSYTADLLHISQPALSATIRKLEKDLETELFLRKGRNIVLSPYGEVFREYVEDAFSSLENGRQAITRMKNADAHTLNLGILSPYMWNELTESFHNAYPEIKVHITSAEEDNYSESIISGETDFYLGSINGIEKNIRPQIEYTTLYEDDMVILMNTSHPFAGRKEITLSECGNESFISLNPNTSLQQFTDLLWEKSGITPKTIMTCDYTLRDLMVSKNYGISITTMRSAKECSLPDVCFCKIIKPADKRKLGLVWRKNDKPFTSAMQKFYDLAIKMYNCSENDKIADNNQK